MAEVEHALNAQKEVHVVSHSPLTALALHCHFSMYLYLPVFHFANFKFKLQFLLCLIKFLESVSCFILSASFYVITHLILSV